MRESNPFSDRMVQKEITPEFIENAANRDLSPVIEDKLEKTVERLENTYSCVATVEKSEEHYHRDTRYQITVIATKDADMKEVERGANSILYWLSEREI